MLPKAVCNVTLKILLEYPQGIPCFKCHPECHPECHPDCQDQWNMVRSHTVMIWSPLVAQKSLLGCGGCDGGKNKYSE